MHLPFSLTFSLTGPLGEDVYGCSCMAAFQLYCSAWGVLSSLPQNTSHLSSFSLYKQSKTLKKNHEWKKKFTNLDLLFYFIILSYLPFLFKAEMAIPCWYTNIIPRIRRQLPQTLLSSIWFLLKKKIHKGDFGFFIYIVWSYVFLKNILLLSGTESIC